MKKPETRLQKRICSLLDKENVPYVPCSDVGKGISDIILCLDGRYIEIEVKKPQTGRQRANQECRQIRIEVAGGGKYYLVDSVERMLEIIKENRV